MDEKDLYTGNGLTPSVSTIILPCAPIALVERLDILMASKAAGNTCVRNELVSVYDESITKRTYKKKYVIEGAGIFGSIGNFFARMFSSNAANQLASAALQAGKTAAKDIGLKAIDVGKTVATDAGKKLVEKAAKRLTAAKSQVANVMVPPEEITKKTHEVIAKYVDTSAINLNKLIDGSSVNRPNAFNAIAIQDLIRRINGSGLQVTKFLFLLLLKIIAVILKFTDSPIIDESIESMSITNTNLLLAPVLITVVMSKLVLNRKMYSHILARAT